MPSKPPSWNQIRDNARRFVIRFRDSHSEKSEGHEYMRAFLEIFGVDPVRVALYEETAQRASRGGAAGYIDMIWPGVLAFEMKSEGKDLEIAEAQALDYLDSLDDAMRPPVVVTSDFKNIRVLDLLAPDRKPITVPLFDLPKEVRHFGFIAGYQRRQHSTPRAEAEANVKAAGLLGLLYEALAADNYPDHQASILLTRLLFLLFGDDTGMWERNLLSEFIQTRTAGDGSDLGAQLMSLFTVLDQPVERRSSAVDETLMRFPYVNGGLFSERLDTPYFNQHARRVLLNACAFDWSQLSPAIFGSLFQSVKSKEARRELGEHYTTETNILKLIQPLFLDELRDRFDKAFHSPTSLKTLHADLGKMRFVDPACGCGNFLVVAYRELRRLDLDIQKRLRDLSSGTDQPALDVDATIGVGVSQHQFIGFELEAWPAKIATVAMFLVDQQANLELAAEFGIAPDRLPIVDADAATIHNVNALKADWTELIGAPDENVAILGNPPFVGRNVRSDSQKAEQKAVWGKAYNVNLDYVTCWYLLTVQYFGRYKGRWAFVSTNSVGQGEQVAHLYKPILAAGWRIRFAHRGFRWDSEAPGRAAVHVSIVGFDGKTTPKPLLWTYNEDGSGKGDLHEAPRINGYLTDGPNVLVSSRTKPLSDEMSPIYFGSMPNDGGNLVVEPKDVAEVRADPIAARYLRPFIGADQLVNSRERWCLWLVGLDAADLAKSNLLAKRIAACKQVRLASKNPDTVKSAATPHLFWHIAQPTTEYLCVPQVVSSSRPYVTAARYSAVVIASNLTSVAADPDGFLFAVLSSSAFMAWQRAIGGRLKSDIRFSGTYSYNSFPLPAVTARQRAEVVAGGARILDVRTSVGGSLADLYNPLAMRPELVRAHSALDRLVDQMFTSGKVTDNSDRQRYLFRSYAKLTGQSVEDTLFD